MWARKRWIVPSSRFHAMTPRQMPSSSMIRSSAKYSTKNSALWRKRLLVERVDDRMAGAVGGGAGAVGRRPLAVFHHVPAERPLIDLPGFGARERHAEMLQFDDRRDRLAAHVFDRVLVAEPVRALDRVVHVPAPVVVAHVAERGGNAALRGDGVAAGREHLAEMQAVFSPSSVVPRVARRPAPPAPTTTTSYS